MNDERIVYIGLEKYEFDELSCDMVEERLKDSAIKDSFERDYSTPFRSEIIRAFDEHFKQKDLTKSIAYLRRKALRRKKKQWVDTAIKNYEEKTQEPPLELYSYYINLNAIHSAEQSLPEEQRTVYNVEEKVQSMVEQLKDWMDDNTKPLCSYPYFSMKDKRTRKRAIFEDLAYYIGTLIEELYERAEEENNDTIILVNDSLPFDHKNSNVEFELVEGEEYGKEPLYRRKEQPLDSIEIQYEVSMTEGDPNMKIKNKKNYDNVLYPNLNNDDQFVISAILSNAKAEFATSRRITFRLADVLKDINAGDSNNSYKMLERKLEKLKGYTGVMRLIDKNGPVRTRMYGILDYVDISYEEQTGRIATVTINESIYNQIIQNQTYRIYKEQIYSLPQQTRSFLLYLQKLRIESHKQDGNSASILMNYTDFVMNIKFYAKLKTTIKKQIKQELDTLVDRGIVIQNYMNDGDNYRIDFVPVQPEEVEEIVIGSKDINENKKIISLLGSKLKDQLIPAPIDVEESE